MEKKFKIKTNKMFSNKMFSKLLNYVAAFIILTIIILFISRINYFEKRNVIYTVRQYDIDPRKIPENDKILIKKSIDSLNSQVNELKKIKVELDEIQKKNDEEFRLYLAIIGSILAIVGFFGFKSIHDTRQAAMEAVKIKAEDVAEKVTESKVEEYVKQNISPLVREYLNNEGNVIIVKHSKETAETIAYNQAEIITKNIAIEEFTRLRATYDEAKRVLREDLDIIERDRKSLLKRIQDLEERSYGKPIAEDPESDDITNNSETVV